MTTARTIRSAADETGLSADTLRYYERIGILPGIARSESGHRRFSDDDLGWIRLVQCLRSTGMSVEDLHRYAELMQEGDSTAPDRLRLLQDHHRRITDELRELATALELVERKIAGYAQIAGGVVIDPPGGRPRVRQRRTRRGGAAER